MSERIFVSVPADIGEREEVIPDAVPVDIQEAYGIVSEHADRVSEVQALSLAEQASEILEAARVGFIPHDFYVIVHAPPPERRSESGLHLDQAESLDANLPLHGTVVAVGRWVADYDVGDQVLIRRYAGIQAEFNGDTNYWFLNPNAGEILGRFDTTPRGESQE